MTAALLLATLLARIALVSAPYYVDGPNHVRGVSDGSLFIQPPGYFLFAFTARAISTILRIPAVLAISAMNIAFSVAGVWVFRIITRKLFPGMLGYLLACCYAVSNVVWFAAEIQSTYASMTFFGPLLFYAILREKTAWVWMVWAVLAGFRPSDGVFLLPAVIYATLRRPWRHNLFGILLAAVICAAWYVPTFQYFGGSVFSPFSTAGQQLGAQLPSGLAVHGFTAKGFGNLLHFLFGTLNAWNVLLPFIVLGLFEKDRLKWLAVLWLLPAILFFALFYLSDSLYLAFLVAPGTVLAGFGLRRFLGFRWSAAIATTCMALACVHMLLLRPILPARSVPVTVVNSYSLEYTRWALQHRYAKRLASALTELPH